MRALPLALLFLLAVPEPAEACSLFHGFAETAPREGGRIPRNGVWYVSGFEVDPVEATWLDFDVFIPLRVEPHASVYEIYNDGTYFGREAIVSAESGRPDVEAIRREFRVVSFDDLVAPAVGEVISATAMYREENSSMCIDEGFYVELVVDLIADDFGLGAFYLFEATPGQPLQLVSSRLGPDGAATENVTIGVVAGVTPGERCYFVRAIDLAGNFADSELVCVDLQRVVEQPDAGVVDAGTMGASGGLGRAPTRAPLDGRGCACGVERRGRGASPVAVLVIGLWAWVRRRAHRR
ncbi:MAG: hypothetical protein RMA76_05540 [Deltaproteobacteria bacterium]|jgi:hypothetical protein